MTCRGIVTSSTFVQVLFLLKIYKMRYALIFIPLVVLFTLAACGQEESFEYTPNGYPFKWHVNAEGESPKNGEYIHFRMYIRNEDGIVHSTVKNKIGTDGKDFITAPFVLHKTPVGRIVPQMDAFSIMSPGDSLTIYYRLDTLARKPQNFENSDYMYYDLKLLDVVSAQQHSRNFAQQERQKVIARKAVRARGPEIEQLIKDMAASYKKGELDDKITTTNTGLKYLILEEGEGDLVRSANYVKTHYMGALANTGVVFENSFAIGDPVEILIGERKIVPGLEEFFRYTNNGTKAVAFIKPELAYGENSKDPVPPNSEVMFYVEIVGIK